MQPPHEQLLVKVSLGAMSKRQREQNDMVARPRRHEDYHSPTETSLAATLRRDILFVEAVARTKMPYQATRVPKERQLGGSQGPYVVRWRRSLRTSKACVSGLDS